MKTKKTYLLYVRNSINYSNLKKTIKFKLKYQESILAGAIN